MQVQDRPYLTGRTFLFSIAKGEDLLQTIQQFCVHHQIPCGFIQGIGAINEATYSVYDQKAKKYIKFNKTEEMEILSLSGNVSLFDDKPMVHAHITLSDKDGKAFGGHLMAGTKIYSAEIYIQELSGDPKIRKNDKATQLSLWSNPVALK